MRRECGSPEKLHLGLFGRLIRCPAAFRSGQLGDHVQSDGQVNPGPLSWANVWYPASLSDMLTGVNLWRGSRCCGIKCPPCLWLHKLIEHILTTSGHLGKASGHESGRGRAPTVCGLRKKYTDPYCKKRERGRKYNAVCFLSLHRNIKPCSLFTGQNDLKINWLHFILQYVHFP